MMKKIRGFSLILCAYSVLAGCNKSTVDVKEKAGEEIVSMEKAEYSFPEKYEKTSDSEKVKFNCELEVPENIKGQAISTVDVKGLYSCDREKAWTIFGEGKEIIEKPETPVDEGRAPEDYYLFANDESLDINEGITYGSSNSKYYSYIGAQSSDNQAVFEETEVSFKSGEECITEFKKIIDELGYHSEDFIFSCYPLNFQIMKKLEEQYLQEGYLAEEKRKESWSQEDDAYFIYAYQKYEDILYQILREGEKLGILMIITVESFSGMNISMRLSDLLKTRICFYMKDTYSYTEAFNIIQIPVLPKKGIPGRGIAYYGERILEFQTALAVKEQNDYRRQEKIRQILDRRVAV